MLWLCLQLPDFPLEICSRGAPPDEPLAVSEGEGREQRLIAVSASARRAGVRPGMRVSEAFVLAHRLRVRPRETAAEADALARLAAWCGRYTSYVSLLAPDALLLEVGGSLALYGGLDRLIEHVRGGVAELGYTACLAAAPTPLGAAWLARCGREARILDHAELAGALAELPLDCLGLEPKQEELLRGLGLATLIDCVRLPRDGIARRVGPHVLDLLDRAFGRKPDPRPAFVPPEHFRARLTLPAPATMRDALLFPLRRLLFELAGFLLARGLGALSLEIALHGARASAMRFTLRLATPSRDPQYLTSLVRERLERLLLAEPVEDVALEVTAFAPLGAQAGDFFTGFETPAERRAQLLERLQARLGRDAVQGLATRADHRPERAWCAVVPGASSRAPGNGRRPLWLLSEPMALEVRDGRPYWEGPLTLEPDCERIESGWWDGAEARRDYFIARHPDGRCFWVFRDLRAPAQWFLHGLFG